MPPPAITLTFDLLTRKPNQRVLAQIHNDLILVKLALAPIVMKTFHSHGFLSHCLLWPLSLTFWLQNLNSTSMNPNIFVIKFGWNSLHRFCDMVFTRFFRRTNSLTLHLHLFAHRKRLQTYKNKVGPDNKAYSTCAYSCPHWSSTFKSMHKNHKNTKIKSTTNEYGHS